MTQQIYHFGLSKPVTLTPVCGATNVVVKTNGKVLISERNIPLAKREPDVPLAKTEHASLTMSPKGMNMTLKVILPTRMATESEFLRQLERLFDVYRMGDC